MPEEAKMIDFSVLTGNLNATVSAASPREAVAQALTLAPEGTEISLIARVKQIGKPILYVGTKPILEELGMMSEELVSLHAIYCDCERCREVRHGKRTESR